MISSEVADPDDGSRDEVVTIERLVPGGAGLARRASGEILFVEGAYPGDTVVPRNVGYKGKTAFSRGFVLMQPSLDRVRPGCRHFDRCGGCDLMGLGLPAQKRSKLSIIEQALRRTGGIEWTEIAWTASPRSLEYRERIRLQIGAGKLGFFAPGSHDIVPIEQCLVARPELHDALARLNDLHRKQPHHFASFQGVELRVVSRPGPERGPVLLVNLIPVPDPQGHAAQDWRLERSALASVLPSTSVIRIDRGGAEPVRDYVFERGWVYARPGRFSQVNPEVNREMIECVKGLAREARTFLDLYCGSGNFSIPLLAMGLSGVGVEFEVEAVELARLALAEQAAPGWGSGRFVSADSSVFARRELKGQSFDLVIVDPPRAGAKQVLDAIFTATGTTLVMVSCDPVTLARDLKVLIGRGMILESVRAFDMFPQTHHVETMAILKKN